MNIQSLFASAAINIGLSLFLLSLFSIFKKHPSNSFIYYASRFSKGDRVHFSPTFYLSSFLPSVSWIRNAFRVSEDEILQNSGLDALVVIRLFKLGIKFFLTCSAAGLVILLPVNYTSQGVPPKCSLSHSMDAFTISNIQSGSNRLWVHFLCLCIISFHGMYLLYKEYNEILVRRIQHLHTVRRRPDQFTILVREIPFCNEHKARGCHVDHFFTKHHPFAYQSYQMVYDATVLKDFLDEAKSTAKKIKNLKKRSMSQKHSKKSRLFGFFQRSVVEDIGPHQKKLQELCHKIRHIQCGNMLKQKELPVAFVSFKSRKGAILAAQSQHHENPLLWITQLSPEPRDILWHNLSITYNYLPFHKIGSGLAASLLTIFFAIPVTAVQGIAKFETLKKWFPPAMAIQLIPGLSSVVTGYLPSLILNMFIYVIPFAMLAIATQEGFVSRSKREIKACSMVFYFLVGNVFFMSLLSGSLLDQIGESVTHPREFPSHLASAVSAQADFFMTYILTGLSGFSLEILQPGLLIWDFLISHTFGRSENENPYLFSMPYYRVIPFVSLAILIGMVYAVIAPLLLPFLIGYFFLGYMVWVNQIQDVYEIVYETCGEYWPHIHQYIITAIILMQITMIGVFGLKSKPAASISTILLSLFTILFSEYCKIRFLPTFSNYPIQNAVENDERDEKDGLTEETEHGSRIEAYLQPCMKPINYSAQLESSSTQPLVSSA